MYRIELLKTHTHAGEVHFAGSVLEVDEMTASWLIQHGIGQAANEIAGSVSAEPAVSKAEVSADSAKNKPKPQLTNQQLEE